MQMSPPVQRGTRLNSKRARMFQVARNILVTGSNRGIGFGLVKELVNINPPQGHIFATCKNPTGSESKEFLPLLKKAAKETTNVGGNKAVVVNMSSIISSIGQGFKTPTKLPPGYQYRVSKTALNMVNACLAEELKQDGIACVLLHPGWVKTDMGSEQAPMTVETSTKGLVKVISGLDSSSSGTFLDWQGKKIIW